MASSVSLKRELAELTSAMRAEGKTWREIARIVQERQGVNGRTAFRLARGWTQAEVARRYNTAWPDASPKTLKHISYWEKWEPNALPSNSARAPSYRDLDRLAQLYECSVSDLLEYPDYSDRDVNAHGKSMVFSDIHDEIRSLRHRLTEPTAAIVTPGLHRDDNYTRTSIRTGLLAQYESLTNSYRQIDYQAGARTVYSDTIAHLNRLLVASDKVSSALYRRYAALLSDTAQLAAWLAIDGQDYVTARHFCSIALSGAEECEDATLRSYVLGVMSYIHLHARRGGEALRLLESALRIANTPRAVRSWLYEAMAESYAFSGDRSSGVKALRRAEQLFDAVQPDSVPRWLGFFNSQEHAARLQGRCLMRLGEGRAAITTLQAACDLLPDHYVRERSGTLIDLASAQIMDANQFTNQPEPEAAASTLQEAWRLADLTNSGRNQRRVRELIPSFQPYAHLDSIQSLTHMVQ